MHSILLVDDQKIVRDGICKMLQEVGLTFERIYQASCSAKAIEIIDRYAPDIVLLDIVMPGEDGFSVVKYIHEHNIRTGIIIITSYDEFDYAVKAIKYNVSDFLLKPVNKVELYQAIYTLSNKQTGGTPESKLYYYILLGCYVDGKAINIDTDQLYHHTGLAALADRSIRVLVVSSRQSDGQMTQQFERLSAAYKTDHRSIVYYPKSESAFVYIVPDTGESSGDADLIRRIGEEAGDCAIGVSEAGSVHDLRRLYREASAACAYALSHALSHQPVQFSDHDLIRYTIGSAERELEEVVRGTDESRIAECMDGLFRHLSILEQRIGLIQNEIAALLHRLSTRILAGYALGTTRAGLADPGSLSLLHLKAQTIAALKNLMAQAREAGDIPLPVRKMVNYIEQHYCQDISLTLVANRLDINYYHASSLFNKHTGMNFADFLNRLRLEKAAELLSCSDVRVFDIATKVGFASEKYFFRKFKDYFGLTPIEYRNNHSALC
jgi:two-component system response regulator YesN